MSKELDRKNRRWRGPTVRMICIEQHGDGIVCVEFGGTEQVSAHRTIDSQLHSRIIEAMPAWHRKAFSGPDGPSYLHVRLPQTLIARVAAAVGWRVSNAFPKLLGGDEIVLKLSRLLLEDAEGGGKRGRLYAESLSAALVAHLLATYGVKGTRPRRVSQLPPGLLRRVTDYLDDHLDEGLSIRQLASVVGLSPTHFSALFTRATGISPHRFITQKRVERAKELLTFGTDTIAQVATQVGFCDQSHLTKQMRRVLGVCPGQLRPEGGSNPRRSDFEARAAPE